MADFANVQPDEYKLLGCNFSAGRPFGIKGVTIHHMAGDLNAAQCNSIWAANGCSAHYSVDRNGYIVQHVNDTDRAYACGDGIGTGGGNDTTISIEHANSARGPWTVHEAAIESGTHLVAALCLYYGLGRPAWMVNVFPAQALVVHGLSRRAGWLAARPLHAARRRVVRRDGRRRAVVRADCAARGDPRCAFGVAGRAGRFPSLHWRQCSRTLLAAP